MDKTALRLAPSGSLPVPGPIGVIIRLVAGAWLLLAAWSIFSQAPALLARGTPPAAWLVLFTLSAMGGYIGNSGIWNPASAALVIGLAGYIGLHLGASFALAGLRRTPGGEMRSIPDLLQSGESQVEHYCPGPLDRLDRWEHERRDRSEVT